MATEQWKKDNADKMREYRRKWYKDNAARAKARVVARKKELNEWFKQQKAQLKCSNCPEDQVECLDFHHNNPEEKEVNLSHVAQTGWSRERIQKEMDKCIVLCSNCHRKLHAKLRVDSLMV